VSYQTGNNQADKHLVDAILRGNANAFGEVIRSTEALVAQIVFKFITNSEDRKDLVQDIYLKAFHKLDSFKFQSKLSTWIAQIAYNTCISWLEKKKLYFPGDLADGDDQQDQLLDTMHYRHSGEQFSEAEIPVMQKERVEILHEEIGNLSPVFQTLITLYHQEEMSYSEMAVISGLPEGTVKSYLFRARKMLKENLLIKYKKEAL
jgi:RNA polymerase sigma factor (sigma-70 family)